MALNPQFPNYANGPAGTEIIGYTIVGGLPLYRLPVRMVETGFGAAMVAEGSTIYAPDDDQFTPPRIVSPGTLEGIFIEGETITHTPPLIEGTVVSQTVTWYARKPTGTVEIASGVNTYDLQASDVGAYIYVEVTATNDFGTDQDTTASYGPVLPNTVPVPVLTANFTPSTEVGTDAVLEITACTNGTVTKVQVYADRAQPIQSVDVTALPVTVTQGGDTLVRYIGQYITFKVSVDDGAGNTVIITYSCGPIVGTAPVITGTGEITGTATAGSTLTFTPPTVTGTPAPTVVYNWYRTGSGAVIATGLTYVATDSDLGKFLYVTTTATNILGGDTATSENFGPILGTAPVITDPGVLAPDNVSSGGIITLDPIPAATGNPTPAISWIWRDGVDEDRVLQLGGTTYQAKDTDIGTSIVVESRATNLSGEDTALSNEVSVDTAPPTVVTPSQLLDLTPEVRQQIGGVKATFAGYPKPVITSFGFYDYTDALNPVLLVDGKDVTTYDVKDEDFGKVIAFVTFAENEYGTASSVSTLSAPVAGFLRIVGESQENWTGTPLPDTVLTGEQATFAGVPAPVISQFGFAYDNGDGTYSPILSSVGNDRYTIQTSDVGTNIVFYTTATNAANPTGLTSYSNGTGIIPGPFEFLSDGSIIVPGGGSGDVQSISVSSPGAGYIWFLSPTRTVTISGDGTGATATALLREEGNVILATIADGSSTAGGSGTITLSGSGSETDLVISWTTVSPTTTTIDPNPSITGGVGWTQANLEACIAGTYGTITYAGDPITEGPSYELAAYVGCGIASVTVDTAGSNYTSATAVVDANPAEVPYVTDATLSVTLSSGGGGAPVPGDVLTLDYAVTNPRNQENVPPGDTVLTWIWVRDDAPTVPITTPNAPSYTVLPSDFGRKIMVVWTATAALDGDKIYSQTPYTLPVGGAAPAVVTPGSLAGDVSSIPATITLTPPVFSGTNVTTTWVWIDDEGTVWQTGGLTLNTTESMAGQKMQVKTTATNFAGTATDTTPFTGVIGAADVPVFDYNGTITGPVDYYRSAYHLDPADASSPSGAPTVVTWDWITAADAAGTTAVIDFPGDRNRLSFSTLGIPDDYFADRYLLVKSTATNDRGQTATAVTNAIGPMGRLPTLTQQAQLSGTFQVYETITMSKQWAFDNATTVTWEWIASPDPLFTTPDDDIILQVGGLTCQLTPETLGYYIGSRAFATNIYGTINRGTVPYGPVDPSPNPFIVKDGEIVGDLIYSTNQPIQFLLPRTVNTEVGSEHEWTWELETAPGVYKFLQSNGTILNLDWFSTVGDYFTLGTQLLGKRLCVNYTVHNVGGGTTTKRFFSEKLTDCVIGTQGDGSLVIEGGTATATGPAVYSGQTLTVEEPLLQFMTRGNEYNPDPRLADPAKGGVNPDVTINWIFGDTASGITSVNVVSNGCYPEKPTAVVLGDSIEPAVLDIQYQATKGVYVVTGVEPVNYVNNDFGTVEIQAPFNYPGGKPIVKDWTISYRPSDNAKWISQITIQDPGYGFVDPSDLVVVGSGLPITNQQFIPTYGFLTNGINLTSAGNGYVEREHDILVLSPYDDLPLVATASNTDVATVLATNTTTYTLPTGLDSLPTDGIINVSITARGTSVDSVAPVMLTGANPYQYFAPNGQLPSLLVRPTLYGNARTSSGGAVVSVTPPTFATHVNPGVVYSGPVNPKLGAPAEVGAVPIYPNFVSYAWEHGPVSGAGPWTVFARNTLSVDLANPSYGIPNGHIVQCVITFSNGNSLSISETSDALEYNGTSLESVGWCGYLSFTRVEGGVIMAVLQPTLDASAQNPKPGQVRGFNLNFVASQLQAQLVQVRPDGTTVINNMGTVTPNNEMTYVFPANYVWQGAIAYVQMVNSQNTQQACISNVVATAPVSTYVANGLPAALANPAAAGVNAAISPGTGGWLEQNAYVPIFTSGVNGIVESYLTAVPPVGNLTRTTGGGIPYGAVEARAFCGGVVSTTTDVTSAPTSDAKFNTHPGLPTAPTIPFYIGYNQISYFANRFVIGFQWDWVFQDITNIGLYAGAAKNKWRFPNNFGLIAPSGNSQTQLKIDGPPVSVAYLQNITPGFQYRATLADLNWKPLIDCQVVVGDVLRWGLYDRDQANYRRPVSPDFNTIDAWWVIANPDGTGIQRVIYAPDPTAWTQSTLVSQNWIGKMVGIEMQAQMPASTNPREEVSSPFTYYWAGYVSTTRNTPLPFPPQVDP